MGSTKTSARNLAVVDDDAFRARLAAIVDSSDDAIVSKTLDGVITSWNRAAERMFGYTPAEAVGQHIYLIVPDDRRAEEQEVLRRLRQGEKIDHFETVRRKKDGRLFPISLTVSPIRDSKGTLVGASKVARDITERLEAQAALKRAHDELEERVRERTADLSGANEWQRIEAQRAQLFTRLVLAQEDERQRIARELHDQLGQQMTALRLTLETLRTLASERGELRAQVEMLQELARQLDQDISFRVWELTPAVLQDVGLAAALTEYAGNWSKRCGVLAEVHMTRPTAPLTPDMETTIYRFAQEALNNVAKHARAARVDVVLEYSPGHVSLIVEDNGVGFEPSAREVTDGGFGLIGMRERAALAGADFQIESAPGKGTTVILRVPAAAGDASTRG
jgi:PAS domain S-box-containing protein